jgi:hypothetical protein
MLRCVVGVFLVVVSVGIAVSPVFACEREPSIQVECCGRLRHGVVAIGGETTGTTITFDRVTWELKLPDEASRKFAADHHKEPIVVTGSLRQVTGTEIPTRWIVDVERIATQDANSQKEGVTVTGTLKILDATTGEPGEMAVESNGTRLLVDLSEDANVASRAKSLVGKIVKLNGRIERAPGPKAPLRMMIRVLKLEAQPERSAASR